HAALALAALGQALTDDRDQVQRQLRLLELLLKRIEERDHALDGHRRVGGVDGGEDQVSRVRRPQRGGQRKAVANLADQDGVGILVTMRRMTMASFSRLWKMLVRNRATPGTL